MYSESSLTKRIKRHVVGRVRTYFAVTAPGFEELCLKEIKALGLPLENAAAVPGGVEFQGRLMACYQANLHLRTAGRILMRIDQFKATNFRQIENKAARIPWELYLPANSLARINVSTHHCRIYHSDAISERILNCISKSRLQVSPAANSAGSANQTLYIRGLADRFTVSVDSSGTHLHKRGIKKPAGPAPLRETTAAAALMLAGYRGQKPLIDPMCGTGTFSLEAAMIAKNLPSGGFRQFAFMDWPSFRRKQWEYLKQKSIADSSEISPQIYASDIDPVACNRLKKCLTHHPLSENIRISHQDFFDIDPKDLTDRSGLVVINPPYGRRLENRPKSEGLFLDICARLKRKYKGWQIILISPTRRLAQKVPFELAKHPISHGGLKPIVMIGKII
jgi:putative N6-adenine-specific DNA methylase